MLRKLKLLQKHLPQQHQQQKHQQLLQHQPLLQHQQQKHQPLLQHLQNKFPFIRVLMLKRQNFSSVSFFLLEISDKKKDTVC